MATIGIWFVYGLLQIVAAYQGIALYWGPFIALGLVFAALLLPFQFIITIGAFYGAMAVWNWNIYLSGIFVLPGLMMMIPDISDELSAKLFALLHLRHLPPRH